MLKLKQGDVVRIAEVRNLREIPVQGLENDVQPYVSLVGDEEAKRGEQNHLQKKFRSQHDGDEPPRHDQSA